MNILYITISIISFAFCIYAGLKHNYVATPSCLLLSLKVDWFVKTILCYFLDALLNEQYETKSVTEGVRRTTGVTLFVNLQTTPHCLFLFISPLPLNALQSESCNLTIDDICDCYKTRNNYLNPRGHPYTPGNFLYTPPHTLHSSKVSL